MTTDAPDMAATLDAYYDSLHESPEVAEAVSAYHDRHGTETLRNWRDEDYPLPCPSKEQAHG